MLIAGAYLKKQTLNYKRLCMYALAAHNEMSIDFDTHYRLCTLMHGNLNIKKAHYDLMNNKTLTFWNEINSSCKKLAYRTDGLF